MTERVAGLKFERFEEFERSVAFRVLCSGFEEFEVPINRDVEYSI